MFVCLFVCLFLCLFVCSFVCLCVCLAGWLLDWLHGLLFGWVRVCIPFQAIAIARNGLQLSLRSLCLQMFSGTTFPFNITSGIWSKYPLFRACVGNPGSPRVEGGSLQKAHPNNKGAVYQILSWTFGFGLGFVPLKLVDFIGTRVVPNPCSRQATP